MAWVDRERLGGCKEDRLMIGLVLKGCERDETEMGFCLLVCQ